MITTIYLIRHSEPFKTHRGIELVKESFLKRNEKSPLSINGEKMAEQWALNEEFKDIDSVWSSNYVRTMSTAKYFAFNNNVKVNVDARFNERVHGIDDISELPADFEIKQFNDVDYKIGYGESRKEVSKRMKEALIEIIDKYKGKRVIIVGHSTGLAYLLSNYCEISYDNDYKFNGKPFFDGKWNYLETFKLEFNINNELISIENIR